MREVWKRDVKKRAVNGRKERGLRMGEKGGKKERKRGGKKRKT
jgi:hypothetical protein